MVAKRQLALIFTCALALIVPANPAQAGSKRTSFSVRSTVAGSTAATVEAQHLYVVDPYVGAAYGFPLRAGIPQSKPDFFVTSGRQRSPWSSVAVDSAGYVYIGEGAPGWILVFAPGAHGHATPVRVLKGEYYPWAIAVDRDGYLYASQASNSEVFVFAPGANGTDPPVQVIPLPTFPEGFAVDASGSHLYVNVAAGIDVVADPRTAPHIVRTLRPTAYDSLFVGFSLGLWQSELYAQFEPFTGVRATDIAVLPTAGNPPTLSPRDGRTRSLRRIYSKSCRWQPYGIIYSMVANDRYLYVSCESPSAVFVYDRLHGGYENPVAAIYGPFLSTGQIAVGP